jgi:hypothetical protein
MLCRCNRAEGDEEPGVSGIISHVERQLAKASGNQHGFVTANLNAQIPVDSGPTNWSGLSRVSPTITATSNNTSGTALDSVSPFLLMTVYLKL